MGTRWDVWAATNPKQVEVWHSGGCLDELEDLSFRSLTFNELLGALNELE